jgi:FtsZ-binding cell division protein ZapB
LEGEAQELIGLALHELREQRDSLQSEIQALQQRRDQLSKEIGGSFTGQSEDIAKRVRGFQEYLVGALQDLAASAEQAQLVSQPLLVQPSTLDLQQAVEAAAPQAAPAAAGLFSQDEAIIRDWLASFQGQPDFSADPWRLRRTLDAEGATVLEEWFLQQGGRGAQPSRGTRHRNVVVAAAAIAILGDLYGDRFQTLVMASQPERLGEWRRGLQDCLGLSREDFGPNSGIVLFERPEALVERADRLEEQNELPFIVIDAAERAIAIPILQFPLWLAFAGTPLEMAAEDDLY